jgi:predicted DNA-binding transcriptional regulator AlpA
LSIEDVLVEIASLPVAELPHALGQLREAEAAAMARLLVPTAPAPPAEERLLDINEAAQRLGTTADYLYRHWKKLPFARKYPFGLRFSESGLAAYIRRRNG